MLVKIPLFLLAVGVGYFVALKATEEVGFLKHLGNAIAGIMIGVGLLGIVASGYMAYKTCAAKGGFLCPFSNTPSQQTK